MEPVFISVEESDLVPEVDLPEVVAGEPEAQTSTRLHPPASPAYFTYNRVSWKLNVRKEVFSPREQVSNPLVLHLVFCQVVKDTLAKQTPRITKDERNEMLQVNGLFYYATD